jgi:TRAP-type C4-dicarboxylate transport system permease small subunit
MFDKIAGGLKKSYSGLAMVSGFMLATATLLAAINAIMRYGFNAGMPWSEELCTYFCILLTFLILGWLEITDNQLKIDIFNTSVKNELVKKTVFIIRGIITVGIYIILLKSGLNTIKSTYNTQAVTYILHLPRYMLYFVVAAAYGLVILGWSAILLLHKGKSL